MECVNRMENSHDENFSVDLGLSGGQTIILFRKYFYCHWTNRHRLSTRITGWIYLEDGKHFNADCVTMKLPMKVEHRENVKKKRKGKKEKEIFLLFLALFQECQLCIAAKIILWQKLWQIFFTKFFKVKVTILV